MQQITKIANLKGLIKMATAIGFITGLFVAILGASAPNNVLGAEFKPYGSIAQEDKLFTHYKGEYWVNTGVMLGNGNGQFMSTGLVGSYSIDEAISEFGIYEDTESFIIEPKYKGKYSNVLFLYEIDGYGFELKDVYEDESGLDQYLTQLENSK